MEQAVLEKFSKNLFWDADLLDLDTDKHASYIVGRVLEYGQWEDWLFLLQYYGLNRIKDISLRLRSLEKKSLAFIATVTQVPENQFRCYELLQSKDTHWYF
jgi:hypothetical protein